MVLNFFLISLSSPRCDVRALPALGESHCTLSASAVFTFLDRVLQIFLSPPFLLFELFSFRTSSFPLGWECARVRFVPRIFPSSLVRRVPRLCFAITPSSSSPSQRTIVFIALSIIPHSQTISLSFLIFDAEAKRFCCRDCVVAFSLPCAILVSGLLPCVANPPGRSVLKR